VAARDALTRTGLWLTCGGLVVLIARHIITFADGGFGLDSVMLAGGTIAGYVAIGAGICLNAGWWNHRAAFPSPRTDAAWPGPGTGAAPPVAADARSETPQMCATFVEWAESLEPDAPIWPAFDQLVREMLTEHLGAGRVRCFAVEPTEQQLCSLAQREEADAPPQSARTGILGHVVTTGDEFIAEDGAHGELLDQLAAEGENRWDWVWPVRSRGATVGLLAVGRLPQAWRAERQTIGQLVGAFWAHVACLDELRIARRTDKASGVLTRGDFFEAASRATADAYEDNEPIVVAALALEGLRGLDDVGRWRTRDELVERLGRLVRRRMRSDDVIGRFSDDRFVVLLRRLDSGLGRLIAEKLLHVANSQIVAPLVERAGGAARIQLRIGLAGSGLERKSFESLMVSAFETVERARRQGVPISTDIEDSALAGVPQSAGSPEAS